MTTRASIPIVLILVFAAGCGGGDTLSKAEFIEKADAICARADKTKNGEAAGYQKAHLKELVPLSRAENVEKLVIAVLLPSVQKEVEEIEALGPPSEDKKKVEDFTRAVEAAMKKAEKKPADVANFYASPFRDADKIAQEYGFKNCSEIT
jgi:hypothetical protein